MSRRVLLTTHELIEDFAKRVVGLRPTNIRGTCDPAFHGQPGVRCVENLSFGRNLFATWNIHDERYERVWFMFLGSDGEPVCVDVTEAVLG